MTQDIHERARALLSDQQSLRSSEQAWLREHLRSCAACREYSEGMEQLVRALRSVPFAAKPSLVLSTRSRVRMRATELRHRRERLWLVILSCASVSLFAAGSTAFLWRGFEWLGRWAQVPDSVWQLAFAMFWIAPTIAASFLFLAHGTHLADRNGSVRG
jgi:predicted anti-sigma-YlaC factor YlaD